MRDLSFMEKIQGKVLPIVLLCFALYGLLCKFLISISTHLHSDSVYLGLLSIEFWKHQNYLLNECHFSAGTNYLFVEWIPFVLVPQVFSNFDPSILRIMGFVLYVMVIAVFSFIVYKISNSTTNSLIFAALMTNLTPAASVLYISPAIHISTIFFTGMLTILFLYLLENDFNISKSKLLFFLILLNLIYFSDSIVLAWFVLPVTAYYMLLYKNKSFRSNLVLILMSVSIVFTYIFETYFTRCYLIHKFSGVAISSVPNIIDKNVPLYLKGMSLLLCGNWELDIFKYAIISCYVLLLYFVIRKFVFKRDAKSECVYSILVISFFIVSAIYVCSDLAVDIGTTRYLTFTALAVIFLISLYDTKNKFYIGIIFIILLCGIMPNFSYVNDLNFQPNQNELELIDYLEMNNLSYGYGDYWDANILTYLSNEDVIIRPISIVNGAIVPFRIVSCERWFDQRHGGSGDMFIIYNKNHNIIVKDVDVNSLIDATPPEKMLNFREYQIYVFKNLSFSDWLGLENWNGIPTRWMKNDATLHIYSEENCTAELSFQTASFRRPRTLKIYAGDLLKADETVPSDFITIRTPIDFRKGDNIIRLHVTEECERPCDIIPNWKTQNDRRCLSLAVQNITIISPISSTNKNILVKYPIMLPS